MELCAVHYRLHQGRHRHRLLLNEYPFKRMVYIPAVSLFFYLRQRPSYAVRSDES
jgi:hypothetical protein